MAMMGPGEWAPAAEACNKFARMDHQLAQRLGRLSQEQARDDKLAVAIEAGRVYGLRAMKYNLRLRQELNGELRQPLSEKMW